MDLETVIEVEDLRRSFKEKEAVAGISFSIERGEIFGLLGPNGAGKTTTIRLLTGQIDPNGGRARVAGCDVVRDRTKLKALIGVVFEDQNLYDRLSGRDNLRFSCWLYDLPESRADDMLALVNLADRAKSPVRTYSTGMKQRLMIARALCISRRCSSWTNPRVASIRFPHAISAASSRGCDRKEPPSC
jgi:ABC-2 type transport system ATP-binding protein